VYSALVKGENFQIPLLQRHLTYSWRKFKVSALI